MKNSDLRELTDRQVVEMIADESVNLTKMRLSHGVSAIESPMKIVQTKRLIARLLTEKRRREIEASNANN